MALSEGLDYEGASLGINELFDGISQGTCYGSPTLVGEGEVGEVSGVEV